MKIALIGATGFVGSKLLTEALDRRHEVTAIVSDAAKLPANDRLHGVAVDATDRDALCAAVASHDVVISAYNPRRDPTGNGTRAILQGVRQAGVQRLLAVGGASTLEVAPGKRVLDQPDFPAEWREGAVRTAAFFDQLREEHDLDWVFLSPSAELGPGERTGHYRTGKDQLLVGADGKSRISLEDYAVAMLDEAEQPKHHRERFTVGY